ncbi:hypothetical protein MFIFM68171_03320 [Madurella fahalii]|uniref:Uncharacterized protein n=1 Tax=Madurella fahalii TaxID=1157608 RepID=A0ABQ0G6B4_9PEZI
MLELWTYGFRGIGAIAMDPGSGQWVVSRRPLTYDMNNVVATAGCPAEMFERDGPFDNAADFFDARAADFCAHFWHQRNVAGGDPVTARRENLARRCFKDLIPGNMDNGIDDGNQISSRPFCDGLVPDNIVIDPETLRITGMVTLGFSNAMPKQFGEDVPSWLMLEHPLSWLDNSKTDEFLALFGRRKEQFIRAVGRVEATMPMQPDHPRLSGRMRESWETGCFWFNLMSRNSFGVEKIYWTIWKGRC